MKYQFSDLVNIQHLRKLMNSFYEATGIPHGIHDIDGSILSGIGWQDICTKYHRVCPEAEYNCLKSDSYISKHLHEVAFVGYKCLNGLMDYGTPIIVEGQHLATMFLGQLLHEPPDEELFRRQARKYRFDEAAYIESLRRVPIIPKERVESIMSFYSQLAQLLALMGLEKKRELMRSEDEYKTVFENTGTATIIVDKELTLSLANMECSNIFGVTREEIEGNKNWLEFIVEEDRDRVKKYHRLRLNDPNSAPRIYEVQIIDKQGNVKDLLATVGMIPGSKKTVVSLLDITKRKRAEKALRQSEERFFKAFHASSAMMSITRLRDNILTDVNNTLANSLGFSREQIIGRSSIELNIWSEPEKREELLRLLSEQGSVKNFEAKFFKKSGDSCFILLSVNIVNFNGEESLLSTLIDITERKRMEDELRQSEERFSKAFNSSPAAMAIHLVSDNTIIDINDKFLEITGYTREEAIGKTATGLRLIVNMEDLPKMLIVKEVKAVFNIEMKFRKKSGEERLGLFNGVIINISNVPCMLWMMNDITELAQFQNEMARLDRLNLVGEMAAGIGHEVRNPMTTVKGFLQLFRAKKEFGNYTEQLDLMVEEIDRANSIITEFLSLAKNKAVDLNRRSLNKIVKSLFPLIQADALKDDKNITLELKDIPMLLLDEKEIRQVILNLVRNGLEAMPPGGNLSIRTFKEEGEVTLSVNDQGTGIKAEVLEKLGTPFFTTKENGTGLGLAVCYSIAARHNAAISIDTGPSGTAFNVRFKL